MMAWSDDHSLKSEEIAGSVNTNPVVIRRMLCELAHGNLIVSQTGAGGGSRLARKPEQITLLDVYRTVESPGVFSLHRHTPNPRCPVGRNIGNVLGGVREEIDLAIERILSGITIQDIKVRLKDHGGISGEQLRRQPAVN
jgi:DNA-binding IscR family transcriptional regulator